MNAMDSSEENNYQTINQVYKIWKKNTPFLYNMLQSYELPSSSQTVQWFADDYIENDWKFSTLLIGSTSVTSNEISIVSVGLPTDEAAVNYTCYNEEKPQQQIGTNGYIGTLGQQNLSTKTILPQSSQIMKARINPNQENFIAVKTGGINPELFVYDLRNKNEEIEDEALKLIGHTSEGYGLCWSSVAKNLVLSGSLDKNMYIWDINEAFDEVEPLNSFQWSQEVEDVKWSAKDRNIFASAHQNEYMNLWDVRESNGKPFISRKAHTGDVLTIDFNPHSEHLLLSGGEDSDICLWDIRNMSKKLHLFIGHNDAVSVISWNPIHPLQFASGSFDRRIVYWNIQKVNENTKEKPNSEILFIHGGHRSKVTDLGWSKDQHVMASCEENSIMQVWKMNHNIL